MTTLTTSLKSFASLNRAPGPTWTDATKRKAPHKPLLLLAVLDLFGAKDAPKYLYWQEVHQAYAAGHSLLVYQHFPRIAREVFIAKLTERFREVTGSPDIQAFSTAHVVFFLVRQHKFPRFSLSPCWEGQLCEAAIKH